MEQIGDKTAGDIQMLIHEQLYKQDETYHKLVDFFEYMPIKVHLLKKGIFVAYLQEKAGSVPKVDRINMEQQEFKKFEKLMA